MTTTPKINEQGKARRREAGQWLRKLRNEAGLTQKQVGDANKYEYYTFVGNIESGISRLPLEHYAGWAKVLNVDTEEFAWKLTELYDPELFKLLRGKR